MCGIAGIVSRDSPESRLADIGRMNDLQSHRGPDDSGSFSFENVTLGHRRLSIFDLSSAGHQPMRSADGRYAIVHNGEIYNFLELRGELERSGRQFRTETDTEVILAAWDAWGTACFERFNGMWAFAIVDCTRRQLILSRDRLGVKPLYVARCRGGLLFASEIKAIVGVRPELRQASDAYIHHFLPSGALDDGEETFFAGVRSFPAGSHAVMALDTIDCTPQRFWNPAERIGCVNVDRKDPAGQLRSLLEDSIRLRCRADVPVGTCLSGGIDSSAIVGFMSRQSPRPVHTFSGLYADADCDEQQYVEHVNRRWNCVAHSVTPEPGPKLLEELATITWHQDEPTAGPGLFTQFHVMDIARREVKVLLDGQGGDELFAGYLPYFAARLRDLNSSGRLADRLSAWRLAVEIRKHWGPQWLGTFPFGPPGRIRQIAARVGRRLRRATTTMPEPAFFDDAFVARTAVQPILRQWPRTGSSELADTLFWHTTRQSIPALLHYEDRNSMAYGIEARVPLLDYRIVEFALSLPDEFKIRGSWTKWVLREAAREVLPQEVADRRSKLGYPTPFSRWIRQPVERELMADLLLSDRFVSRQIVPAGTVRHYWDRHQSGAFDHGWLLYRYATLELWFRHFIDGFHPVAPPSRG